MRFALVATSSLLGNSERLAVANSVRRFGKRRQQRFAISFTERPVATIWQLVQSAAGSLVRTIERQRSVRFRWPHCATAASQSSATADSVSCCAAAEANACCFWLRVGQQSVFECAAEFGQLASWLWHFAERLRCANWQLFC